MIRLAARYGDAWNWWAFDEAEESTRERIGALVLELDRACESEGRDPSTLERTLDLYTVVPPGLSPEGLNAERPIQGTADQIADRLLSLASLGFGEVRCDLWPRNLEAIEAMKPVVDLVHTR